MTTVVDRVAVRLAALEDTLRRLDLPIDGVTLLDAMTTPPTVTVLLDPTRATADDRTTAASIVAGFDWNAAP